VSLRAGPAVLCALLAGLCVAACLAPRHVLPARTDAPAALQDELTGQLARRYPPAYRAVHRLAISAGGKQYDLVGYLVVTGPDTLRALALGELGGRIFDLALAAGAPAILKKPNSMPPRPLTHGVIGDLRHLFLPPPPHLAFARSPEGSPALLGEESGERAVEYVFDVAGRHLERSVESEGGRVVREVSYSDYRALGPGAEEVPTRIILENRRWRYRLIAELLELIPGAPPREGGAE